MWFMVFDREHSTQNWKMITIDQKLDDLIDPLQDQNN